MDIHGDGQRKTEDRNNPIRDLPSNFADVLCKGTPLEMHKKAIQKTILSFFLYKISSFVKFIIYIKHYKNTLDVWNQRDIITILSKYIESWSMSFLVLTIKWRNFNLHCSLTNSDHHSTVNYSLSQYQYKMIFSNRWIY